MSAHWVKQDTLSTLKRMAEINIPKMRSQFGLQGNVLTWPTLLKQRVPMVIPIRPGTFPRPNDWHEDLVCSDFIFLQSKNQVGDLELLKKSLKS